MWAFSLIGCDIFSFLITLDLLYIVIFCSLLRLTLWQLYFRQLDNYFRQYFRQFRQLDFLQNLNANTKSLRSWASIFMVLFVMWNYIISSVGTIWLFNHSCTYFNLKCRGEFHHVKSYIEQWKQNFS